MRKTAKYKSCERCSKPYKAYLYNFDARRFCSTDCANKTNAPIISAKQRSKVTQNLTDNKKWRYNILYIEWRNQCLIRDNFTCQNCDKTLTLRTAIVHHPKSWKDHPELRYDIDNGQTLCRSCHNTIHVLPSRKKNSGF